jgi:outer membrane protein assembly factor BamB
LRLPLKLTQKLAIVKGRNGRLSPLLAARGESVFLEANDDVLDSSGGAESIRRLNGRTGHEVWRVPADRLGIASVVGDNLFVTNGPWTSSRAISIESGRVVYGLNARQLWLWRNRWLLMTEAGLVVADPATGATLETRAPLPVSPSGAGVVSIDGDVMLYQVEDDTQAVAYDLSRQKLLWKRPLKREIAERSGCEVDAVTLRPMDPNVFLAHVRSTVVAGCSLKDGSILWDRVVQIEAPVVPHNDRVYVMQHVFQKSPRLICLDAVTGVPVYDVVQPELHGMDIAGYGRIYEDHIGFGTRGGLVGLFRLADGHLSWSYRYTERHRSNVPLHAPVIADDRLYTCAGDGHLLLFEPA